MQNLSLDKQLLIFLNEAFDKRLLFAITFTIISISILTVGLLWPKSYESSTTLLWNKASALQPLLEGTAVTNAGNEQSRIAKEVIYGSSNLQTLIEETGLNYSAAGDKLSDREIEILKANLRIMIKLQQNRNNTIKISYINRSPDLAFHVVSVISQLFIEESTLKKKTESNDAYDFIENQVNKYQAKLKGITKNINEFKSKNVELQVDTTQRVSARVSNLKEAIEITSLNLKEAIIQKETLTEQLVIESAKSNFVEEENVNNERLITLENQLNTLRLSYTETYPDIVQINEQIKILRKSMEANANKQFNNAVTLDSDKSNSGSSVKVRTQLYQQLQQRLSAVETTIRTLSARKNDQEKQLSFELGRSNEVSRVFNRLNELSRDYDVTKAIYDRLLTRRENARVSLNLENESAGSLYKVQEPPTIPLIPQGLRFLHFALGSIVGGVGIPLAIIFGLLFIDSRIRHEDDIDSDDAIPVIGVIPIFNNGKELKKQRLVTIQSIMIFSLSFAVLITLSLSRYYEVI